MGTSEDRSGPLVTCTGNPCKSTGTSSPVSTGDIPVLPVQVTNGPDRSSEVLIISYAIIGGEIVESTYTFIISDPDVVLPFPFNIPNGTKWNFLWKMSSIMTGFYTKSWFEMKSSQFHRNLLTCPQILVLEY